MPCDNDDVSDFCRGLLGIAGSELLSYHPALLVLKPSNYRSCHRVWSKSGHGTMKSHPSNVSLHIYASEVGMTQPAQGQIWQKCTDQGGEAIGPVGYAQGSEVHGRLLSLFQRAVRKLTGNSGYLQNCDCGFQHACGFQHTQCGWLLASCQVTS